MALPTLREDLEAMKPIFWYGYLIEVLKSAAGYSYICIPSHREFVIYSKSEHMNYDQALLSAKNEVVLEECVKLINRSQSAYTKAGSVREKAKRVCQKARRTRQKIGQISEKPRQVRSAAIN